MRRLKGGSCFKYRICSLPCDDATDVSKQYWGRGLRKVLYERIGLTARKAAETRLASTPPLEGAEVALLVLKHELKVVQRAVDASQTLEAKASGLAVLDLALIGVLATVAIEHRTGYPWISVISLVAFLFSIFFAWLVNRVEAHNLPSPVTYNLPTIANDGSNLAKIAQELTEAWDGYATDERNAGALKASFLKKSFGAMYCGVIAFAIVTALGMFTPSSGVGPEPRGKPPLRTTYQVPAPVIASKTCYTEANGKGTRCSAGPGPTAAPERPARRDSYRN
jgi:hypothetical protein